ncbi:MAG TPA: sigma factor [Kofleriaceae bacterium]
MTIARAEFEELVVDVRRELHRYCARMTGSVIDGEDIVQDTLERAFAALAEGGELPPLRPLLFRIAHNRAIDHLRAYDRKMGEPLDVEPAGDMLAADEVIARDDALTAAIARFLELPPVPRSCVILKDVLGYSLEDLCAQLELGLPAAKAALHRGRMKLRELGDARTREPVPARDHSPVLVRFAELFNARDWDGVRALLAEDVRLHVVERTKRKGRRDVGVYFTNYERFTDWHLELAWLDGREVLAVRREVEPYVIEVTPSGDKVSSIHDFRHIPYIGTDARLIVAAAAGR